MKKLPRAQRPLRRGLLLAWLLTAAACEIPRASYRLETPAPPGSQLPHLASDPHGRPVLSWVEATDGGHRLVYATRADAGWQPSVHVASGPGWFVNWADVPSVEPLDDGLWAAHWLVKQPGGMYAYDIALAVSRDGGHTWDSPFTPHRDGTPTEHGFVSLWPAWLEDGTVGVGAVWLDGRHTLVDPSRSSRSGANFVRVRRAALARDHSHAAEDQRMTLRSAVFDPAGREVTAAEVDDRVCDCCPTDVAVMDTGPWVAYRNRSEQEVRDIHLASATPTGWQPLGPAAEDGWLIRGCPVNGPAIAAAGEDVVLAWYTEAEGKRRVRMSRYELTGGGWSPVVDVDADDVIGRVDVAMLADGAAAVSWLGAVEEGRASILLARVSAGGAVGEPVSVAEVAASRPAGFPRIVRHGDGVLVAWTLWENGVSRVVTAQIPGTDLLPPE